MKHNEISLVLQAGEGQYVEFKEGVGVSFAKEFVAFANAEGGRIFIGVNDANHVVGVDVSNRLISQIEDIAHNCDPSVQVTVSKCQYEEKDILIVNILEGTKRPYSCSDGYYLRVGACSQKMRRDELFEFVRRVQPFCFDEQICPDFSYPTQSQPESQLESQPESLDQRVLAFLKQGSWSKAEISAHLGQKEISGQLNKIIRVLVEQGFIEYTIPDKPNSRLQKYRITERGRKEIL